MSTDLTTKEAVEEKFGGTWAPWGAGRVPVGVDTGDTDFDTVEETGGEKTHVLTYGEMPSHAHYQQLPAGNRETEYWIHYRESGTGATYYKVKSEAIETLAASRADFMMTAEAGNDRAHNNLQPYITCYMYKRTA